MAKGRIVIPPRKSIKKNIKQIIKRGPAMPRRQPLVQGPAKSHAHQVQLSRIPRPSENQRGRVKSINPKDLTR